MSDRARATPGRSVFVQLAEALQGGPLTIAVLVDRTGLPVATLAGSVAGLLAAGYLRALPGDRWALTGKRPPSAGPTPRCPSCGQRVRLRRPDLTVRCRCGKTRLAPSPSPPAAARPAPHGGALASRPAAPPPRPARDQLPTRAEARRWVAAGVYDPPPGVRYELEAWTPVL